MAESPGQPAAPALDPIVRARAVRLAKLDKRLAPLYVRAVKHRDAATPADAMHCAHLVREIMDGCLTAVGQVPVNDQVLPRLKKMQGSVDTIIAEMEAGPTLTGDDVRTRLLSSLKALRTPSERVVEMPEMMKVVVREMGLADPSRQEAVAQIAAAARKQANPNLHLGEKNRDEPARRRGAQQCLATLELFLDAVDSAFTPKLTAMKAFQDRANAGEAFSKDDCKQLAALLASDDAIRHFFLGLKRVECLPGLRGARLIAPRAPTVSTNTGESLDPRWWAGEYLLNMATDHPKEVVDAVLDQAGESISQSVSSVIRRLAIKLPPAEYRRLHDRVLRDLGA
jgi:hypothetical protein